MFYCSPRRSLFWRGDGSLVQTSNPWPGKGVWVKAREVAGAWPQGGTGCACGQAEGEMRSLLWLSLLWPTSVAHFLLIYISHAADLGEGREATAGMELPVLDLPAGGEPGCSLTPWHRSPGSSCGQATDQLPFSLPAWCCTLRNMVLLSTETCFCL